jgi:hypothetical protein
LVAEAGREPSLGRRQAIDGPEGGTGEMKAQNKTGTSDA